MRVPDFIKIVFFLLAHFSIMVPHQIDQPHPTKQKSTQKNWETATMMLMIKDPILARALSNCEKRGMPTHRQKSPESKVPLMGESLT